MILMLHLFPMKTDVFETVAFRAVITRQIKYSLDRLPERC